MRFIHTADWQIGKSFRRYGEREDQLKRARLDAIERIGALAMAQNAPFVMVAGDVYDHFAPAQRTANEPLERMRAYPGVNWLLLPGNHDPHRPDAIWDRLMRGGLPVNVKPLLSPGVIELASVSQSGAGVCLLPAPLLRKHVQCHYLSLLAHHKCLQSVFLHQAEQLQVHSVGQCCCQAEMRSTA